MKSLFGVALLVACFAAASLPIRAQAPESGSTPGSGQSQPAAGGQNPAANSAPAQQPPRTTTQTNSNPFPEDTTSVPIIPTHDTPDLPPGAGGDAGNFGLPMPPDDADPMRSPEDAAAAESSDSSSSSSLSGIRDLPPPDNDDDTPQRGKHKGKGEQVVPEHHETAAEDESVGSYYLENKDWKGALSRFQSALVLDPDNPDVYWGLAECERHTGDFADARANYLKVREYDPGSRHAKEAGKALEDPEIANAKPDASGPTSPQPHQ
jgi:tetratricopeptide (TPR) repeat protein